MHDSYTDWTLVSLSPLSRHALLALVILTVLAAAVVIASYRGGKRQHLLMLTRFLGALLVVGFLVEPALQLRVVRRIKNRLAVVVDRSRSMTLASENGATRYDAALGMLAESADALGSLGESHYVDWFDLEGPVSPSSLKNPPVAEGTDLLTALETARQAGGGKPTAGILLISDGADNAELEGTEASVLSEQAKTRLRHLGVPVNTLYAGGGGFRDIAIADVRGDEFAFVHNTFEIEVVLDQVGFGGATLPLTLKRDGEVVATQTAVLGSGRSTRVSIKSKPDRIGEYVYSISVPVLSGEAVAANNERSFVLSVIRDKIRVLQVAGRPSWDERFLRQHLKENPNVDLISFFILRTPTDVQVAADDELSLIPFPVEKLFTTELASFDVIVFQNFDYRPYRMSQYLPNIRAAVRNSGLGFVMVGGEGSFGGGGYATTELNDILPLVPSEAEMVDAKVQPVLTPAGRAHPVTDLTRGASPNEAAWRSLGAWSSYNHTGGLAEGATALVSGSLPAGQGGAGAPPPLVAVMDAGLGRTMAIATDSMWRWRFSASPDGGASERAYHRFWSNALRWLVRDPEHSRVRVTPDRRRFDVGSASDVTFTVLGQDYQPVAAAAVRATLEGGGRTSRTDDLTTGENGSVRYRYTDLPPGAYHVRAEASAGGKKIGVGLGVFVVESHSLELSRGGPRADLLGALAKETGGASLELNHDAWQNLELQDPEVVEVDRRRNIELWDNGWALLAGVVILCLEWALRRRRGYL